MIQATTTSAGTVLERAYHWERTTPDEVYLVQPMGGGVVRELTWKQALDEARRIAAYLKSLELPERSHVALFSKNSAWWILADLAIDGSTPHDTSLFGADRFAPVASVAA